MDASDSTAMWLLSGSVLACVALLLVVVLALAVPVVAAALTATLLEKGRAQAPRAHRQEHDAATGPTGLRATSPAARPSRFRDGAAA